MWYVMQVVSGREGHTVLLMERILSQGILENCFVPMRRMKKKYEGRWQEVKEKLFPGYVFLISEQPQLLYDELKQIPALTKLLGSCEEYFTPLSEKDVHFLRNCRGYSQGDMGKAKDVPRVQMEFVHSGKGKNQMRCLWDCRKWLWERTKESKSYRDPLKIWRGRLRR